LPTRRRITAAYQLARRLAAAVMLRQWAIEEQLADTPSNRIARLLGAVEATGLRLHVPGRPGTHALLERWTQALALLDVHIAQAEDALAAGPGQADIRSHHRGGDPVTQRITPGQAMPCADCPYEAACDHGTCLHAGEPRTGPTWQRPPAFTDADLAHLRSLRDVAHDRLRYDLAWLEDAIAKSDNRGTRGVSAGQGGSIDKTG
jgi:hypothetical protein